MTGFLRCALLFLLSVPARAHPLFPVRDSSSRVTGAALRTLSVLDPEGSTDILERFLEKPSHGEVVSGAALNALMSAESARGIAAALRKAQPGNPAGLRTLALSILAGCSPEDPAGEQLLLRTPAERMRGLRAAGVRLLGDVGKEEVMHVLELMASNPRRADGAGARAQADRIRTRLSEQKTGSSKP